MDGLKDSLRRDICGESHQETAREGHSHPGRRSSVLHGKELDAPRNLCVVAGLGPHLQTPGPCSAICESLPLPSLSIFALMASSPTHLHIPTSSHAFGWPVMWFLAGLEEDALGSNGKDGAKPKRPPPVRCPEQTRQSDRRPVSSCQELGKWGVMASWVQVSFRGNGSFGTN